MNSLSTKRLLLLIACTLLLASTDVFATSNPIPGIGVVIKRNPGSGSYRTTTDKDGNFKIEGLEPGTYTIEVVQAEVDKFFAATTTENAKRVRTESTLSTARMAEAGNAGNAGNTG